MVIMTALEYAGTFMFALSGAHIACKEEMDYFGILSMAAVTAMGGGVIRDAVFHPGAPAAFFNYGGYLLIFAAVILVIAARGNILDHIIMTAVDAVGLAAFTVSAGIGMLEAGWNCPSVLFAAFITAVGGGMLRDIIVNRKPLIFCHDIYAVASLAGAAVLFFLYKIMPPITAASISFSVVFCIRMVCYIKKSNLPVIQSKASTLP